MTNLTNVMAVDQIKNKAHLNWIRIADESLEGRIMKGYLDVSLERVPETVLNKLVATFEARGFHVFVAHNGEEAFVTIRVNMPAAK